MTVRAARVGVVAAKRSNLVRGRDSARNQSLLAPPSGLSLLLNLHNTQPPQRDSPTPTMALSEQSNMLYDVCSSPTGSVSGLPTGLKRAWSSSDQSELGPQPLSFGEHPHYSLTCALYPSLLTPSSCSPSWLVLSGTRHALVLALPVWRVRPPNLTLVLNSLCKAQL